MERKGKWNDPKGGFKPQPTKGKYNDPKGGFKPHFGNGQDSSGGKHQLCAIIGDEGEGC